jgi:molybdopterin-dependent oxidoreductase alpha subunit
MPDHASDHRIVKPQGDALRRAIPFGLGQIKPQHFRDMLKITWLNRDNLPYAYKVLTKGVCDGCALGVAGLHDWTIKGTHLCMTRLNLLRLNTMPALDPQLLSDLEPLKRMNNQQLRELGRLGHPMHRRRGEKGFQRITWEEAFQRLAARIRPMDKKRLAFFCTSRGVTNEVYYAAQKAARFIGTNNIDNAARLCHSPSTAAMKAALGVSASTCAYTDWIGTDLIVFFGSNPANDQPVATKYLHQAKAAGTRVVMVNPYLEPGMKRYWVPSTLSSALFGTDITDYWFPVAQNGDVAFLYGVIKVLFARGWTDATFVSEHTRGADELRAEAERLEWKALEEGSGLSRAAMEEFAELIGNARNAVLVWSMGITQHRNGTDAVRMILNLGLLRGYVGRDKCGLVPIRGHSSVQGGAEMGAYSTAFPGGKPVNPENAAALAAQYGFDVPDWQGLTATGMVEACGRGELDLLYCLGGNFLRTLPDPEYVRQALSNVPVRVHQDIILSDQLFVDPGEEVFLLPAKTRYEQDDGGNETSTERRIMFSPEIPRQVGEARAEWKILLDLARAVDPDRGDLLGCETGWKMREEIARVIPFYDGVQHLRKTGDAFQYGGQHLCANGHFPTPDGKGGIAPVPLPVRSAARGLFHASTRRGKQFNTLIYAEVDPLNGAPRDAVLINHQDAANLHLRKGDRVLLRNSLGDLPCTVFPADIARGNLQVHWPEGNVIIQRGQSDSGGGVPDYNALVEIVKPGSMATPAPSTPALHP